LSNFLKHHFAHNRENISFARVCLFKYDRHLGDLNKTHVSVSFIGGAPSNHSPNNVNSASRLSSFSSTMFSPMSDRFTSFAASFANVYPVVKNSLQGDYSPISQSCTQQGLSLSFLEEHLNQLGEPRVLADMGPFLLAPHLTHLTDDYREAFMSEPITREATLTMLNGLDDEATASSVSLNAAIGVHMSAVGTFALQLQGEATSIQRLAGQLKVMHTDSLNQREALEQLSPDTLGQWYTVLNESKHIAGDATSLMLAQINNVKGTQIT
jgi:hypothetical protein